jgi:hypothetical protein
LVLDTDFNIPLLLVRVGSFVHHLKSVYEVQKVKVVLRLEKGIRVWTIQHRVLLCFKTADDHELYLFSPLYSLS